MLRRASYLVARARERIRLAAEHDPHAWPEHGHDGGHHYDDPEPFDPVIEPAEDGNGATRPPLGSPQPGASDVDGVGPGGVSGPPQGGRPHRSAERTRRLMGGDLREPPGGSGAAGRRTAAAWSWRLLVVVAGFYALLWAAAYVAVVVVPVIVALLLAA